MRPMPAIATPSYSPTMPSTLSERYVKQLSELNGFISCCVFEIQSGNPIAHAGANPGSSQLAAHGSTLIAAMVAASRALGFGHALPDKTSANLTLARLQVLRMDSLFEEAQTA